jgi:hypothetical protein
VKLFIDKCPSPQLATRLNDTGRHDAVRPLLVGRRGEPDHRVLGWCIAEGIWALLQAALAFIEDCGKPGDVMVNQVLEMDESGAMTLVPLPTS